MNLLSLSPSPFICVSFARAERRQFHHSTGIGLQTLSIALCFSRVYGCLHCKMPKLFNSPCVCAKALKHNKVEHNMREAKFSKALQIPKIFNNAFHMS
jgi:hypothetical protein